MTNNRRKIMLEPHGIRNNLIDFLAKLAVFCKHYCDYFCLILIVHDHYIEVIERFDRKQTSDDFLWKQSN